MARPKRCRVRGQSALELMLLITMAVIALVGLSRYVRFGYAGRLKAGSEGISPIFFDPERTTTTWTTSQKVQDTVDDTGFSHSNVVTPVTVSRTDTTR